MFDKSLSVFDCDFRKYFLKFKNEKFKLLSNILIKSRVF